MVVGGQILDRRGPRQALAVAMLVALLAPPAGSTETVNAAPFALPVSGFATMDQPTGDFAETSPVEETPPISPVAASADKPMFELRGRIDADAIWAQQSAANIADFGKLKDVVGLRRARIGVQGHLNDDLRYVSEIDLATGDVVVRDCFLGWAAPHVQNRQFRLGHFREPFSLEGGISANVFPFLERSPINNLDPSRNWGIGLYQHDDDEAATFAIGLGACCGALVSYLIFFAGDLENEGSPQFLAFVLSLAALGIYWGAEPGQRRRLWCYALGGGVLIWILWPPAVSMARSTRIQMWLTGDLINVPFPPAAAAVGTVLGTLVGMALSYLPRPDTAGTPRNNREEAG
jgi:hypothetical protein